MKNEFLIGVISYNNGKNLYKTLKKINKSFKYKVIVNIDGSTDGSEKYITKKIHKVLFNKKIRELGIQ